MMASLAPKSLVQIANNAKLEEGMVPLPPDHESLGHGLHGGRAKLWGRGNRPPSVDPEDVLPVHEITGGDRVFNAVMRNVMALRRLPNSLDGDKTIRNDFAGFFDLLRAPLSPAVEMSVMFDKRVRNLAGFAQARMCAGERRIERAWSEQLLKERRMSSSTLRQFWYYDNYTGLCDTELGLLHRGEPGLSLTRARDRIAIVGGGALPLTAIMLYDMAGVPITVLDHNPRCCQVANRMLRNLGLDKEITVVPTDGRSFDFKGHTIIFVASNTLGVRDTVAQALRTGTPKRILMRSVDGLRALLYRPVGYDDISGYGMQHVGQSDRTEQYYNSSQAFIPPFGLHGEIGHDSKLDYRFSRYMPHMNFNKNLWLVSLNAQ